MKILMISGTYNRHAKTWLMLDEARKFFEQIATENSIQIEIAQLCDYAICIGQQDTAHQMSELVEKIKQADAIVFSTPNYQGSISGLLKVAIDHIPECGLQNKVVGLVCVSGGIGNMSQPLSHLRDMVSSLEGLAVSTNIACYSADFSTDENGHNLLSNDKIKQRIERMANEIYQVTKSIKQATIK